MCFSNQFNQSSWHGEICFFFFFFVSHTFRILYLYSSINANWRQKVSCTSWINLRVLEIFWCNDCGLFSFLFVFAIVSGSWIFAGKSSEFPSSMECKKHLHNQQLLCRALGGGHQCESMWGLDYNLVHQCGLVSGPVWQHLICRLAFVRVISNLPWLLVIIAQIRVFLMAF